MNYQSESLINHRCKDKSKSIQYYKHVSQSCASKKIKSLWSKYNDNYKWSSTGEGLKQYSTLLTKFSTVIKAVNCPTKLKVVWVPTYTNSGTERLLSICLSLATK